MSSPSQWPPKQEDSDSRGAFTVVGYGIAIVGLFALSTWLLLSAIF